MIAAACAVGLAALPLDAGAAATNSGPMKGRTSQGRSIRLHLRHNAVQTQSFTIRLRCRDGSVLIDKESGFEPAPLKGNRIDDHQVGSTDEVWMKARLRGHVLRGKVRVKDRLGRVRCNSGWVGFHAALARR
jgi:hypothetical protein